MISCNFEKVLFRRSLNGNLPVKTVGHVWKGLIMWDIKNVPKPIYKYLYSPGGKKAWSQQKPAKLFVCRLLWIIAHKETVCQSQALRRWIAGVFLGNDSLKQIELLVVFLTHNAEPQCSITMSGQACAVKALWLLLGYMSPWAYTALFSRKTIGLILSDDRILYKI